MGVSRGKGWTEADIDKDDPEAYHGGGIVTGEIKLREMEEKAKKKRKKQLQLNTQFIAGMKNRREMDEVL